MGALISRLVKPALRHGLAAIAAAVILWPALIAPADARGPEGIADVAE